MDQSFSLDNLQAIWDLQTRKGDRLLSYYPTVADKFEIRRDARKALRQQESEAASATMRHGAVDRANQATTDADAALHDALAETSRTLIQKVEDNTFDWGLHANVEYKGRMTYGLRSDAAAFFADRQLQRTLDGLSERRPPSRQSIAASLGRNMDSKLPKLLIRTDIERFYDNVDHALLKGRLQKEQLTPTFRHLIHSLLDETAALTGTKRGLPRGVGLSAKLAEFFLQDLDRELQAHPRVSFYGRYVDDIVIVYGERESKELDADVTVALVRAAVSRHKLTLSPTKTASLRTDNNGNIPSFDFLGYQFSCRPTLDIRLTQARESEIVRRIDLTFAAWAKASADNHGRRRLLLDRIRYLTGNTRLANNKRNAMIGIYFSNPHLTSSDSLADLDLHLRDSIDAATLPDDLHTKLDAISFTDGYNNRRIHSFTAAQRQQLRGAWNA
jgi:hypothetical protein